jgi:hypothetical protein
MSLFNFYPKINYNNTYSINIAVEVEVVQQYLKDYNNYYTYTIKDGERADIIAESFYGDPTLDWIIYLCNNIVDPYKDWIMTDKDFINYLESKYEMSAYKLASTNTNDTIAYYYYTGLPSDTQAEIDSYNYTLTPFTYDQLGSPSGWTAKSIWELESEKNEAKREIKLLKPVYINKFKQQLRDLFING